MNSIETGALLFSEFQDILQHSTEYISTLDKNDPNLKDLKRLVEITLQISQLRNEIDKNISKNSKKKSKLIQIKIGQLCSKENERYQICQKLIPLLKSEIMKESNKARSSSGAI